MTTQRNQTPVMWPTSNEDGDLYRPFPDTAWSPPDDVQLVFAKPEAADLLSQNAWGTREEYGDEGWLFSCSETHPPEESFTGFGTRESYDIARQVGESLTPVLARGEAKERAEAETREWRLEKSDLDAILSGPVGSALVAMFQHKSGVVKRRVRPNDNLLAQFVGLATQPAARVRAFAHRWGTLGICRHGLPCGHNPGPTFLSLAQTPAGFTGCVPFTALPPTEKRGPVYAEPVWIWQQLSAQAQAILRCADRVRGGGDGEEGDWDQVLSVTGENKTLFQLRCQYHNRTPRWQALIDAVSCWLEVANVRSSLFAGPNVGLNGDLDLVIGSNTLFGALAVQLALAVRNKGGFAMCWGCQKPYERRTAIPKSGRHYCGPCRMAGIPQRYANQVYRKKPSASSVRSTANGHADGATTSNDGDIPPPLGASVLR